MVAWYKQRGNIVLGCLAFSNLLSLTFLILFIVFAVKSDDLKTVTKDLYQLTKTLSQDTKDMKSHLIQALPQSQLHSIISSASQLSNFQQKYPNIHSGLYDLLNNLENNTNSTTFTNIKEFINSLNPELMNKIDDITMTITNTLTPEFIGKINDIMIITRNALTPEFMDKVDTMIEAITNFTNAGSLVENSLLKIMK